MQHFSYHKPKDDNAGIPETLGPVDQHPLVFWHADRSVVDVTEKNKSELKCYMWGWERGIGSIP